MSADSNPAGRLHVDVARTAPHENARVTEEQTRTRGLLIEVGRIQLHGSAPVVRRSSAGITAERAAQAIGSLCRDAAMAAGDSFAVFFDGSDFEVARFPGALQSQFLGMGFGLDDLAAGLAFAVEQGWLSPGRRSGLRGEVETYVYVQNAAAAIEQPNKGA